MITLSTFFEPETTLQRVVKWTAIGLVLCLGLGLFLVNLPDLIAYNEVCKEPVYVEATISVRMESSQYYDEYLSYEYENTMYKDIYYRHVKSWVANEPGTIITVAINPNNPAQLVEHMVQDDFLQLSLLIFSVGLAMLLYGIAIEFAAFRNWRLAKAIRKSSRAIEPDYLMDMFVLSALVAAIVFTVMVLRFPYANSLFDGLPAIVILVPASFALRYMLSLIPGK